MKDKAKSEKEIKPKKTKQQETLSSNDHNSRIESLELLCGSHSALLSEQKGRILSLEVYLEKQVQELSEQRNEQKKQMEFFYGAVSNLYNEIRIPSSGLSRSCLDEVKDELSKSQSSQYSLINQRIDRVYQELQLLVDARGLDLDMKTIVDGLEETVHEFEEKCKHRYSEVRGNLWSHMDASWKQICGISKSHQLLYKLMVFCFFMSSGALLVTITYIINQMFF